MGIATRDSLRKFGQALNLVKVTDPTKQAELDAWKTRLAEWSAEPEDAKVHQAIAALDKAAFKKLSDVLDPGLGVSKLQESWKELRAMAKMEAAALAPAAFDQLVNFQAVLNDVKLSRWGRLTRYGQSHEEFKAQVADLITDPILGRVKDGLNRIETTAMSRCGAAFNFGQFKGVLAKADQEKLQAAWEALKIALDNDFKEKRAAEIAALAEADAKSETTLKGDGKGPASLVDFLVEEQAAAFKLKSKDAATGKPQVDKDGAVTFEVDGQLVQVIDKGNKVKCTPKSYDKTATAMHAADFAHITIETDEEYMPIAVAACKRAGFKAENIHEKPRALPKPKEKEAASDSKEEDKADKSSSSSPARGTALR
ncbi:hypothetical protein BH10PSE19_BH10PSE19_09020 [soil metagenome]